MDRVVTETVARHQNEVEEEMRELPPTSQQLRRTSFLDNGSIMGQKKRVS